MMKKLFLMLAAAALSAQAVNAQTVVESKNTDNWYLGVNGGANVPAKTFKDLANFQAGLRVGRWFTPVVGFAVEGQAHFGNKNAFAGEDGTLKAINANLLGTINFSNWFAGYNGTPRCFEVSGVAGFGWWKNRVGSKDNALVTKLGLDLALNFGSDKQWQVYVEPALVYNIADDKHAKTEFNINRALFTASVGFNYKFGNSNGTHNFKIAELRDQAEIDALNAQINSLKEELAKKPKEVVKEVVKEVAAPAPVVETREVKVENLVFVTFAQGKSALTPEAKKALNEVAEGKHVQIVGTASPEGSKELNDRLSQARADAVADYLKARGVVVDEATGKGVQGTTSNRLAVVYVK